MHYKYSYAFSMMILGPGYDVKLHLTVESQIGLEDRMRLPQTTVTSRWPLAKA